MSPNQEPPCRDDLPLDWVREPYPSADEGWLADSYISTPLAVGFAILIADVREADTDEQVYPIAITEDINTPVTNRTYEIVSVENTLEAARSFAVEAMVEVVSTHASGDAEYVESVSETITDEHVMVGTPSPEIANDVCGNFDHHGDGIRCASCGRSLIAGFPLLARAVRRDSVWLVSGFYCSDCRPCAADLRDGLRPDTEAAHLALSVSLSTRRLIRISGVQLLRHEAERTA